MSNTGDIPITPKHVLETVDLYLRTKNLEQMVEKSPWSRRSITKLLIALGILDSNPKKRQWAQNSRKVFHLYALEKPVKITEVGAKLS